jgi:hypothetical protein
MKARAAAARVRKKQAGTQSTRAAVKRLARGGPSSRNAKENLRQDIKPELVGKDVSKKTARRVRRPLRSTQSQTHRSPP